MPRSIAAKNVEVKLEVPRRQVQDRRTRSNSNALNVLESV